MNVLNSSTSADLNIILEVIESQCTLDRVRTFLKDKGLTHSASSWDKMKDDRIRVHLKSGALSIDDLWMLARDSEEHGSKHVLLYEFSTTLNKQLEHLFDASTLDAEIKKNKELPARNKPILSLHPTTPIVTEIRLDLDGPLPKFVLKITKTLFRRQKAELEQLGQRIVFVSERVPYRAVDVVAIYPTGLMEVRVHTYAESINYDGAAAAAINMCGSLINGSDFKKLSLSSVKNYFSDSKKRDEVAARYEVVEADLNNDLGERVLPSAKQGRGGILASPNLLGVLDNFKKCEADDPFCERVRYILRKSDTRTIPVAITEKVNEIIVMSNLSGEDYDYVISDILRIREETK